MSPFQHGEVYVLDDGAETDLDLGHYERFTSGKLSRLNNLTSGQVYEKVLQKKGVAITSARRFKSFRTLQMKSKIVSHQTIMNLPIL